MCKLFALVGILVASLAVASTATAAPGYITANGVHRYINVYGFNAPVYSWGAPPAEVSVWTGNKAGDKILTKKVVTPNTANLPSPPCRVACEAGQFYVQLELPWDPCTSRTVPNKFWVYVVDAIDASAWVSVSCPPPPQPPYKGCPPGAQGRQPNGQCVCVKNHEGLCS
jgi:hypothetical protein